MIISLGLVYLTHRSTRSTATSWQACNEGWLMMCSGTSMLSAILRVAGQLPHLQIWPEAMTGHSLNKHSARHYANGTAPEHQELIHRERLDVQFSGVDLAQDAQHIVFHVWASQCLDQAGAPRAD